MKIGMIFPGQGSQYVGMGKAFYDQERLVQEYFETASNCLGQNFIKLCFASSEKDLMETVNTQTSIFLVSVSIFSVLKEKYDIKPTIVAGHSSGEYAALYAAGGISFPDALYLLKKRAIFMEETTVNQNGGMLAVFDVPLEELSLIIEQLNNPQDEKSVVEIVNYNTPNQIVLSGTMPELTCVKEKLKAPGAKSVMLKVSGAFHSRLMKEAEGKFSQYLEKVDFHELHSSFINNIAGKKITTAEEIRYSLVKQISSPVLWWQSMQHFYDCDVIVEIAPGRSFAKSLKHQFPHLSVISVNEPKDVIELCTILGKKIETEHISPTEEEGILDDE